MKKNQLLLIPVFALALMLTGCPGPDSGSITASNWVSGLTDFNVSATENSGELSYSFSATNPAADSYMLYYLNLQTASASIIINNGNSISAEPASTANPKKIEGIEFETGITYSFVVVGEKKGYEKTISKVVTVKISGTEDFDKGLDDLAVEQGNNNGQLIYTFSATNPEADSYVLYYIEGDINDAGEIITNGTGIKADPADLVSPGIISELDNDTRYSIIVTAEKSGFAKVYSDIKQGLTKGVWEVELTGLTVLQGDSPGDLIYSFNATTPPADSYALYYLPGETDDAEAIIAANNTRMAEPADVDSPKMISGLRFDTIFSIVVVAVKSNYKTVFSNVVQAATSASDWSKGMEDFNLSQGPGAGELSYSFNETEPAAESYTLYYALGSSFANTQAVIDAANSAATAASGGIKESVALSGKISGLTNNTAYSVVIVAHKSGYSVITSAVNSAVTYQVFTTAPNLQSVQQVQGQPNQLIYQFAAATASGSGTITYTVYYIAEETKDAAYIIANGISKSGTAGTGSAANRTLTLDYNKTYSFVVTADRSPLLKAISNVISASTGNTAWEAAINDLLISAGTLNNALVYQFKAVVPTADSYTLYYKEGNTNNAQDLIGAGAIGVTSISANPAGTVAARTISSLKYSSTYTFVVVARRAQFIDLVSNLATAATGIAQEFIAGPTLTTVTQVTDQPNQLIVTFAGTNAANPSSGTTYTLYWADGNIGSIQTIIQANNSRTIATNSDAITRTITDLKYNTTYSFVVAAKRDGYNDSYSGVVQAATGNTEWTTLPVLQSVILPDAGGHPNQLSYQFTGASPAADSYTVYYIDENTTNAARIIANGTAVNNATAGTDNLANRTLTLKYGTTYSFIVAAKRVQFNDGISNIVTQTTGADVITKVNILESGINTLVSWSFVNHLDEPLSPVSANILTYKYSGLAIESGKLTNNVISGTETQTLANNIREYTITHGGLIAVTDIVISSFGGLAKSTAINTLPVELRLYNAAYAKSREYGAIEMFSFGRADAGTLGGIVQARAHTIVNYQNGNPVNTYGAAFSRGESVLGGGPATQLREWHFDGEYLYGRSNGGNTNIVDGTGLTGAVTPSATAARWADINSVDSSHTGKWTAFSNFFARNPFNYITYNINTAFTDLYQYAYPNPENINNNANLQGGRFDAPYGLIQNTVRGALAYNGDETFQFSILMDGNKTGNKAILEWSGNVSVTTFGHSSITFVIDADMRFVRYNSMDRYTVDLLSATTNVAATMYFVYHEDNIDLNNYAIFRPHQTRPGHMNFVASGVSPESVIAPNGNVATGNMVVANSRYATTLGWIKNTDEVSKIKIQP